MPDDPPVVGFAISFPYSGHAAADKRSNTSSTLVWLQQDLGEPDFDEDDED